MTISPREREQETDMEFVAPLTTIEQEDLEFLFRSPHSAILNKILKEMPIIINSKSFALEEQRNPIHHYEEGMYGRDKSYTVGSRTRHNLVADSGERINIPTRGEFYEKSAEQAVKKVIENALNEITTLKNRAEEIINDETTEEDYKMTVKKLLKILSKFEIQLTTKLTKDYDTKEAESFASEMLNIKKRYKAAEDELRKRYTFVPEKIGSMGAVIRILIEEIEESIATGDWMQVKIKQPILLEKMSLYEEKAGETSEQQKTTQPNDAFDQPKPVTAIDLDALKAKFKRRE